MDNRYLDDLADMKHGGDHNGDHDGGCQFKFICFLNFV